MITSKQLLIYDAASRRIDVAACELEAINVAGLEEIDRKWLADAIVEVRRMRHEFFHKAHARFVAERAGDVKPGE